MNSLIIFCAQYLLLVVAVGWVVTGVKQPKERRLHYVAATAIACVVAVVVSRIASKLYYDPRPFVTQHIKPLIAHAADNGFPSDHALFTMTISAVVYLYSKQVALVMLLATLLVGIARVLAHVHSPVDIIAAWLIGVLAAFAGYHLATWLLNKNQKGVEPKDGSTTQAT